MPQHGFWAARSSLPVGLGSSDKASNEPRCSQGPHLHPRPSTLSHGRFQAGGDHRHPRATRPWGLRQGRHTGRRGGMGSILAPPQAS